MPKFNKMYFPVDAIAKHEDFDVGIATENELCASRALGRKSPTASR